MNTARPIWWYLPVTPLKYLESEAAHELKSTASDALQRLRDAQALTWIADLNVSPWESLKDLSVDGESLPPARYEVMLTLVDADHDQEPTRLTLSPAELRLITELDHEIGRRIGDELDGQRP